MRVKQVKNLSVISLLCTFCVFAYVGCMRDDAVKIGLNIEQSGRLAQYGTSCYEGAMLAIEEINQNGGILGKPVKAVVVDNRSQNSDSALAAIRLGSQKDVCAIIGPTTSPATKAAVSAQGGAPIITPSATADDLIGKKDQSLFRICFTDTAQGEAMGVYAAKLGFKKAAMLLDTTSDYSMKISEAFKKNFELNNGTVVTTQFYSSKELDFYTVLTKLKKFDIDCIYLPAYYTEGGLIIKQARELSIDCAFLSGDAFDSPKLGDLAGNPDNLDDIFFTNHYDPNSEEIIQFAIRFFNTYKKYPSAYAVLGYDAVMFLKDAILRANSVERDEILKALSNTTDFKGITGGFFIDEDHNAVKEIILNKIEKGKRSAVYFDSTTAE